MKAKRKKTKDLHATLDPANGVKGKRKRKKREESEEEGAKERKIKPIVTQLEKEEKKEKKRRRQLEKWGEKEDQKTLLAVFKDIATRNARKNPGEGKEGGEANDLDQSDKRPPNPDEKCSERKS
jgi:hypothetical protein